MRHLVFAPAGKKARIIDIVTKHFAYGCAAASRAGGVTSMDGGLHVVG
jgi:hypothetical protein